MSAVRQQARVTFQEGLNTKNTKQKRCPRMCTRRKALAAKARNTKNTKDTEKS